MQSPRYRKTAEKQENGGVRKSGQRPGTRQNAHEHGQNRHQQGSYGHMQSLRQPQDADERQHGKPLGYLRLHGKPLEHGQEKKDITGNDDVIAVSLGFVCRIVAHGGKTE